MQKYQCDPCGYIYDPETGDPDSGIAPGTAFEDMSGMRSRKGYVQSCRLIKAKGRLIKPSFSFYLNYEV